MNVHILATCRKPELLPFTELVFKTLHIGFPTARVFVWGNQLPKYALDAIQPLAEAHPCELCSNEPTIHHRWIERLLASRDEPFFILDTDVIFYRNFEQFIPELKDAALAGFRIPQWKDEFSGCITRARLHTSLLYMDPMAIRKMVSGYEAGIADTVFTPKANLIHPLVVPFGGHPYFYDTCSLLYHAIGGMAFTEQMKQAYAHLNFGTIPDVVLPRLTGGDVMAKARLEILDNLALGYGSHRAQMEYYAERQF